MREDNRGFTLIELLAVILILASISLVAVSGISASLERREEKECEEQQQLAKNAAKIYFSLNDGVTTVKVSELKNGNYFNVNSKTDRLDGESEITIGDSGYIYNGECK